DQCGWLDVVKLTDEDIRKTNQYLENLKRDALMVQHADYDTYLGSLEQKAALREFEPKHLDRITQLINKTNQFNLTTRRSSAGEMAAFAADPERTVLAARLSDRFGDSGLISVAVGRMARGAGEPTLDIETWVMSCRVLGRRVEFAMRDALAEAARRMGARWMIGHYRPTQRNGLVADLYAQLGFDRIGGDDAGGTDWRLELDGDLPRWRSPFAVASS
ncbi:MAG TPA: hypothetical protein VD840_18195, partial [Sinorhizobium sp.]|nr:hypothetical protein [Sinorhizobium sp.]